MQQASSGLESIAQLHREMDRLFDTVFHSFVPNSPSLPFTARGFLNEGGARPKLTELSRPQVDIAADDNQYELVMNVPGLTSDDVTIELQGECLVISGQKLENNNSSDKHYYRVERSLGAFQRTLSLPEDVNTDEIKAHLQDGVLTLSIPRCSVEASDQKRIPISS